MKTEIVEGRITVSDTIPTIKDSPPIIGYLWVYLNDPTIYVCLDNTNNNSRWAHIDKVRIDALIQKYNDYHTKLDKYQKDLTEYMKKVDEILKM